MNIVCLDLEGVLVPEIWIAFAEKTGIEELRLTTRDIPVYRDLMNHRIKILKEHNLKLQDIQEVISGIDPMDGARDFLDTLRERYQVCILSDTFREFAKPLMKKLGYPTLLCNSLQVADDGTIEDIVMRQEDGKFHATEALKNLNCKVMAAGDSYNDTHMLLAADRGFLFKAPQSIIGEFPQLKAYSEYTDLLAEAQDLFGE